jgi:hypothetical protein
LRRAIDQALVTEMREGGKSLVQIAASVDRSPRLHSFGPPINLRAKKWNRFKRRFE